MNNKLNLVKIKLLNRINKLLGNKSYWDIELAYEKLNLQCPSFNYYVCYNNYKRMLTTTIFDSDGSIKSAVDFDRQTGKTTLTIVQALIASQYSKVIIVVQNENVAKYIKKCFYEYARTLNIPNENLVGVISYRDFIDCKILRGINFCIPFIDPMCYTLPLKLKYEQNLA